VLFIGWGTTVRGREERSLEVFNEIMAHNVRLQQEGRIERFDVGSAEQLAALGRRERDIAFGVCARVRGQRGSHV